MQRVSKLKLHPSPSSPRQPNSENSRHSCRYFRPILRRFSASTPLKRLFQSVLDTFQAAVKEEDFSAAARLRDTILELESKDPVKILKAQLEQAIDEQDFKVIHSQGPSRLELVSLSCAVLCKMLAWLERQVTDTEAVRPLSMQSTQLSFCNRRPLGVGTS